MSYRLEAGRDGKVGFYDGSGARVYITSGEAREWESGVLPSSLREKLDAAAQRARGDS